MKYPKIETLFKRDPKTFRVNDQVRLPEFELIRKWHITEKIDGMNARLMFKNANDQLEFSIRGRTDQAQIPSGLLKQFAEEGSFIERLNSSIIDPGLFESLILFGEFTGPKIQRGETYGKKFQFHLFDVWIDGYWMDWSFCNQVAESMNLKIVPFLGRKRSPRTFNNLKRIASFSRVAFCETGQEVLPEGIVARTDPPLFTKQGKRLMWKLKFSDFEEFYDKK